MYFKKVLAISIPILTIKSIADTDIDTPLKMYPIGYQYIYLIFLPILLIIINTLHRRLKTRLEIDHERR